MKLKSVNEIETWNSNFSMLPTSEDLTGMKVEDLENFLETPLLSSERLVVAAVAVVDFEDPGQLNSLESSWSGRPDCWTTRKMGIFFVSI